MSYCPNCNGGGFIIELEPTCCGNLTKGGECRGECAVPQEVAVPCGYCGGNGHMPEEEQQ